MQRRGSLLRTLRAFSLPSGFLTCQQQEIDLVEEHEGGALKAFEFKWADNIKIRFPQTFTDNYPEAETAIISPANLERFILKAFQDVFLSELID